MKRVGLLFFCCNVCLTASPTFPRMKMEEEKMFKIIKRFKKKPLGLVTADYEIRYRRQMQGFIR